MLSVAALNVFYGESHVVRDVSFEVQDGETLAIMGRNAAYSGQQLTWDQALNSQISLVPKPVDWTAKHEVPGLAIPGRTQVV